MEPIRNLFQLKICFPEMGKYLFIVTLGLISTVQTWAQVVPSDLPVPGQRLSYVSYTESGRLDLEAEGRGVNWDFSYLQAPYQKEVSIEPASSGRKSAEFADSDLVLKEVNGYEVYLQQSENNLIEVGRTGGFWMMDDVENMILYDVKPVVKRAGLSFGQSYSDKSSFTIEWSKQDLARMKNSNIPVAFDSIKYEVSVINEVTADGTGQLILPLSIHQVIRLKHEIELTITPFIKTRLGWRKYNEGSDKGISSVLPVGIYHLQRYEFWTESETLPVMYIDVIDDSFSVRYIVSDASIPKVKVYNTNKDVLAFPNPTYGEIEIQLINLPPGIYKLEIDNIFGQSLHTRTFDVNHTRKIKTDLSFLSRGTYLYSIIDSKGNKVATKRVVIITP